MNWNYSETLVAAAFDVVLAVDVVDGDDADTLDADEWTGFVAAANHFDN